MYKKIEFCPSCENNGFNNLLIAKDHLVSDESFAIVQCQTCHLLFTNPRPSDTRLDHYYDSEQYISHNDKKLSVQNLIYRLVRQITLGQKIRIIKKYHSSGTLLDYGAGTGAFLQRAVTHFEVKGVEPSVQAILQASSSIQTRIHTDLDSVVSNDKFDVITMWHVLEHLPSLRVTFDKIKERLSPEGHLFIAVPNPNSWDSKHYGADWAGYDVPRHLCHFGQDAMASFLKQYGLRIVEVRPMKFDAYYVSMLTEKHLQNPQYFIKGLTMGYRSNQSAHLDGEYSSLLYVVGA